MSYKTSAIKLNKYILGIALSCASIADLAHAETPNDGAAILSVTGTVNSSESECHISFDYDSITLNAASIESLPQAGVTDPTINNPNIYINLQGSKEKCTQMEVVFSGNMDSAGNTLMNLLDEQSGAAKGVGIGIYYSNFGVPLNLRNPVPVSTLWGNTSLSDTRQTVPIRAQLVKLPDVTVTSGKVQAALTAELEHL